ncbi:hypothetical protein PR048_004003 [Dryococelus australis]|uniref:Uncharacterized protein n=1 Tax=Dryococelus australis TaxID=614101 RepID=A0ABQ9I5A8_9NEOP|nr:hypothetical protein PR048_004003 [Dryococelus australis]
MIKAYDWLSWPTVDVGPITMDFMGSYPKSQKGKYFLEYTYLFTCWVEEFPLTKTNTKIINSTLEREFFPLLGYIWGVSTMDRHQLSFPGTPNGEVKPGDQEKLWVYMQRQTQTVEQLPTRNLVHPTSSTQQGLRSVPQ